MGFDFRWLFLGSIIATRAESKKKMASRRDSYNQDQGQGQHVLLTGANGFVASHILLRLLEVHTLNKAHPWISKNSTD